MEKTLRSLCWVMGVACLLIGIAHIVVGPAAVPDTGSLTATDDSQNRFFGAIFAGYGLAWIWAARQSPIAGEAVRWLAGIFFVGGIARLVSIAAHGWPHGFVIVLTVLELALPPVYFWLARGTEESRAASVTSAARQIR
ncbi:DUF4345 domain-containing protein [Nocardia shimofusensis]|uniref:DUF4345 domain-containing protein n=1 Tax=Nocardia shimofusensis TaxID=228596 RepID=UPI00082EA658|nr:DUF4345 domain-containing protein [Nocardia shimofusensis]